MAGLPTVNDIIKANTVNNRAKRWNATKAAASYTSGKPYSLWPAGGDPGAGAFTGSAVTSNQFTASDAGAIFFDNPSGGRTNHLTSFLAFLSAAVEGQIVLIDRLLGYQGFVANTTADQTATTTPTLPRYTSGAGCKILVETQVAFSANAGTLEVYYRNESDTDNRVGSALTIDASATASPCRIPTNGGFFHSMQGSDRSVKRINKVKLPTSTFTTGTFSVSIVKPIWSVPFIKGFQPEVLHQALHGIPLDDSGCYQLLFMPYSSTTISVMADICVTEN
jgi:hypothetical protein